MNSITIGGRTYTRDMYKTLSQVLEAQKDESLPARFPLCVTHLSVTLHVSMFEGDEEQHSLRVFHHPDPEKCFGEALDLLGISWELI